MLTIILVSILLLNKQRGGGNHILEFFPLSAFPPFFSTEQMFPTSVSLLTKAVFFWWEKDTPKEIFLQALLPNFFRFPRALPVSPARAQD